MKAPGRVLVLSTCCTPRRLARLQPPHSATWLNRDVGQVSDPYDDEDDEVEVSLAGLSDEPADAATETTPDGQVKTTDADIVEGLGEEVEFDLSGWSEPEHEALTRRLVTEGVLHHWDDYRLVISLDDQSRVEQVLDEVGGGEGEALDGDRDQVAYDLAEWDDDRLVVLGDALAEADIPFDWDDDELFVYEVDEQRVDELIDKVAHPHELAAEDDQDEDGGAELMGELFVVADRLQRDPDSHEMSVTLLDLSRVVEKSSPPYGLTGAQWGQIKQRVEDLSAELTAAPIEENTAAAAARDLRDTIRPFV